MNYYEILGVAKGASKIEIEEAYNEKVNQIKNEVKNENNAASFIKILTEAYEHLIDDYHNEIYENETEEQAEDDYYEDEYYEDDENDNRQQK